MHVLTLPPPSATRAAAFGALATLVEHLGGPGFDAAALGGLNAAQLHAASWSVYALAPAGPPRLHLSASLGITDTTRDCFDVYRDGLYRLDRSFDAVRPGSAAVLRMHADEAPSSGHRERIYRRHGMVERFSVARRAADGALLAVNVYRHEHQGRFGDGEFEGFADLAPLLLAAVQRHVALVDAAAPAGPAAGDERARLHARCPALTPRELDVCERLLRGWSYDGIAADMGLSLASVKTYRARAFARLGLHFRNELFALLRRPH